MKTRIDKLLSKVSRQDKILELGPSYSPTVTRADGWNVYSLDHASGEELRRKYNNDSTVDTSRIQEVDFVWSGGSLESAIPVEHLGTFDVIIASHVIEHQPDLVSFFHSITRILKPKGILSLAIPDKRFCFDYFMPVSLTGDVLEAASAKRTRHSKKSRFNFSGYSALVDGGSGWMQGAIGELSFIKGDIEEAKIVFDAHITEAESPYVDEHTWYFTPSSFRLIALELRALGLIDLEEEEYFPPCGVEFYVSMRQGGANINGRRMELLKQMLMEIREQTDYLVQSKNGISDSEQLVRTAPSLVAPNKPQTQLEYQIRVEELERELSSLKESNSQMSLAIERWNRTPWYSRALHKLRVKAS
jgi:SAM-dependent methyltransferase